MNAKVKATLLKATFKIYQEKKHSRRFRTENEGFPVRDIYLKREFSDLFDEVEMTLEGKGGRK